MLKIPQPGKTKQQLLDKLEDLKKDMQKQVESNEVTLTPITDGYNIKAEKKVLFLTFFVDANIVVKDEAYELSWETNAPESKVEEAIEKIKTALEK